MKISQLLPSMKETIGDMDSRFGYSSKKLTQYFKEIYPYDFSIYGGLSPNELVDDQILSKVTEILVSFENFKKSIKMKYRGYFTIEELNYIYQYFNGSAVVPKGIDVLDPYYQFVNDFYDYGKNNFSSDIEKQNQLSDKLSAIHPIEFYILQYMICEYWNLLPPPLGHKRLLDELMGEEFDDEE